MAIWALTNCPRLFDIEKQLNSIQCRFPSLAQRSGSSWDVLQWLPIQNHWWKFPLASRHLFAPLQCSPAKICPCLLYASALYFWGGKAKPRSQTCLPLLPAAGIALLTGDPPSSIPVQRGWVVDAAWWESWQMQDTSLSSSLRVRVAGLFWLVVLTAGQRGLKHTFSSGQVHFVSQV